MTLVKAEIFFSETLQWCGSLSGTANVAGLWQINKSTLILLRPNLITFSANITQMYSDIYIYTRCGPYFGTTVEAVQCLTYQIRWNIRICKKERKYILFRGGGGCGRQNFFTLSPSYKQSSKNREKSLCPAVEMGHFDMVRWKYHCLYFKRVTRYIGTDFCGRIYFKHSE